MLPLEAPRRVLLTEQRSWWVSVLPSWELELLLLPVGFQWSMTLEGPGKAPQSGHRGWCSVSSLLSHRGLIEAGSGEAVASSVGTSTSIMVMDFVKMVTAVKVTPLARVHCCLSVEN